MIEAYDRTLPYRLGFACVFFLAMGLWDWWKHPENPTRVKEYLFLVAAMIISIVYGIVHDHITATISPEYFLRAKGLETDPRPFRIAVTLLALKATYGPGVFSGALLLIANNPSSDQSSDAINKKPQLTYPHLLRICVYPVWFAALFAVILGVLVPVIGHTTWLRDAAAYYAPDNGAQFMVVWGIHAGSYLGATLGTVVAVVKVVRRRNYLANLEPTGSP